jgi:hypothetical protein
VNTHLLASAFLTLAATLGTAPAWSADTASDAAQVKLQASSMSEIKALAGAAAGYKAKDVEISATAHQLTLTIINSKLNATTVSEREAEATRMVSAIARAIADKPEFSQLPVIHVDYVKRQGSALKAVQRIDFFQSPAGAFVLHKT